MIKNLNIFMENCNGNIYAYKNPKGKNAAWAEYIVDTCQRQGRLFNNKLSIASSGRFAVEVAKVCKQRGINFLPILGKFEDPVSFNQITALGFSIDRTPAQEKEDAIARLRNEGWYYFDLVPGEYEIRMGEPEYTGKVCVIGSGLQEDKLAEAFAE